jgi:hypothetical protein
MEGAGMLNSYGVAKKPAAIIFTNLDLIFTFIFSIFFNHFLRQLPFISTWLRRFQGNA